MAETSRDPGVLANGAAVVDVGALEVIHATGEDRVAFLHRLLTADVEGVPVGGGTRALLLSTKGQIVADMQVCVLADEVRLVVPPGQAAPTAAALARYAIMDDFTATPAAGLEVVAVHGPAAAARLAAAGVAVPEGFADRPRLAHERAGDAWLVRARACGSDGVWAFLPGPRAEALRAAIPRLDPAIAEALRIEAGEPAFGAEIDQDHFPMEVGLGGAIDYGKGCYLGQEPIVRIRDRGHINWRLVRLRVRGDVVPGRGDALESDVKPRAGQVTSAGRLPGHPPVALALLHVSVPAGAEVRVRHGDDALVAEVLED